MPAATERATVTHQAQFHDRWHSLSDVHVRTLAWLLDAPGLLDPAAWDGKVATLGPVDKATAGWLQDIDRSPQRLHDHLGRQPHTRLGRYAETLMAFYLERHGHLVAHGLQVRADKGGTIGEFDFLLEADGGLLHWEFATKLYLLEAGDGLQADCFVGPNLADTLGLKLRKIMDRQLALADHPAARRQLPKPVVAAQALVKGWLFYHAAMPPMALPRGIAAGHCRGFWCTEEEVLQQGAERYLILPRLRWLAPVKAAVDDTLDLAALRAALHAHFTAMGMPVLIAVLQESGSGAWLEADRGFVVPADWRSRAAARARTC